MRQIKFRGRVPDSDKIYGGMIVYGSLVEYSFGRDKFWINPLDGDRNYPVDPDSVAQLVGYDKDKSEVYEGDFMKPEYYKARQNQAKGGRKNADKPLGL